MREGTVLTELAKAQRRDGIALAQHQFLKTEIGAMKSVLVDSTIWQRLKWLIWPELYLEACDASHQRMLEGVRRALSQESAARKLGGGNEKKVAVIHGAGGTFAPVDLNAPTKEG